MNKNNNNDDIHDDYDIDEEKDTDYDINSIQCQLNNDLPDNCSINGIKPEFKHQLPDGSLVDADPNHVLKIKLKAQIANTAQLLANATVDEKTQWAIELREQANQFYYNKQFDLAMECYLQCLVASDFSSDQDNNIDNVIIPVLLNLSACSIELENYDKSIGFCLEALKLRSNCSKALYRIGLSYIKVGEPTKAIDSLTKAKEIQNNFTDNEIIRIDSLLVKAKLLLNGQMKRKQAYKQAIRSAFTRSSDKKYEIKSDNKVVISRNAKDVSSWSLIVGIVYSLFIFLYNKFIRPINKSKNS